MVLQKEAVVCLVCTSEIQSPNNRPRALFSTSQAVWSIAHSLNVQIVDGKTKAQVKRENIIRGDQHLGLFNFGVTLSLRYEREPAFAAV